MSTTTTSEIANFLKCTPSLLERIKTALQDEDLPSPIPAHRVKVKPSAEEIAERNRKYRETYRNKPEVRKRRQEYYSRPEVQERRKSYNRQPKVIHRKKASLNARARFWKTWEEKHPEVKKERTLFTNTFIPDYMQSHWPKLYSNSVDCEESLLEGDTRPNSPYSSPGTPNSCSDYFDQ